MLTDESPMPYGQYKDEKMANVPAHHLIWRYENGKRIDEGVKEYIEENYDDLIDEMNG